MGGAAAERAEALSDVANCLLLCHLCHRWIESHRSDSLEAGWLVNHGDDPREISVEIYRRGRVWLGVEYRPVVAPLAELRITPGRVRVRW